MKKMNSPLRRFLAEARKGDSYWVEKIKLHFALALDDRRKAAGMTCKAVAEKAGVSGPYMTKVLRGDENLTIETMVKLAHSTGGRLSIDIVDAAVEEARWSRTSLVSRVPPSWTASAAAVTSGEFTFLDAANHEIFGEALAA
jgi:transcriptional regulator with XRE-family HTH domain